MQGIKKFSAISTLTMGSAATRQTVVCRLAWYIYGSVFVLGESFSTIIHSPVFTSSVK